jgi:hypothetical protein
VGAGPWSQDDASLVMASGAVEPQTLGWAWGPHEDIRSRTFVTVFQFLAVAASERPRSK